MAHTSYEHDAAQWPSLSFAFTRRFGRFWLLASGATAAPSPCKADRYAARSRPSPPAGAPHGYADSRNAHASRRSTASASTGRSDPHGTHDNGSSIAPPEAHASPPDADLPRAAKGMDELTPQIRPQSFRETTSCNIALSKLRSATSRFTVPLTIASSLPSRRETVTFPRRVE